MRDRVLGPPASWLGREAPHVLPPFRQQRAPARRHLVKGLFLACCAILGVLYGFVYAVFPPFFMVYLAMPVLLLTLLVIWALPHLPNGPTRLLAGMFFAYALIVPLWPNYIALSLPGLPWISFRRLIIFPMALVFFICVSTSERFRHSFKDLRALAGEVPRFILALVAIQLITVPLSNSPFGSLNSIVDFTFGSIIPFFIGTWYFRDVPRAYRWQAAIVWAALLLCGIGILEWMNQRVIWADHIPSFLAVDELTLQRITQPYFRDGQYRVTGTFSVALAFAEFLAFATPFVLHRLFASTGLFAKLAWGAADLLLLAVIISTQSRLGIVGWLVGHAFCVCLWSFRRWLFTKGDLLATAVALAFPAGAFLFFVAMFTVPAIKYRTIGGGSTSLSDDAREIQFDMFWPKFFGNPIGHGAGQSGTELGFRTAEGLYTVDSYFITIGMDYGVVGIVSFFGALVYAIYALSRTALSRPQAPDEDPVPLAAMLLVALVIRSVLSQTDNLPLIFMGLGMAAAALARERQRAAAIQHAGEPKPAFAFA